MSSFLSLFWRSIVSIVVGLFNFIKLVVKGPRYLIEDLAPETLKEADGIVCKPLLPCGLFNISVVHGPDGQTIAHLFNSHEGDPGFRRTLDLFKHIISGFGENKTDASFFIRSDKDAFICRQRSLIPYIRDPKRLTEMFDSAVIEFRTLLDNWAHEGTYQSIDFNLTKVIFGAVSKVFFGLDKLNHEKVYRTNKLIESALNFGSIPNIFRFFSPAQQLMIRAHDAYSETYRELLKMNAESILASDNYTHYIVKQTAAYHLGNTRDYVSHDYVLGSSPLLYLGVANIIASLGHSLLQYHQPEKASLLEALQNEIQQLPSESQQSVQNSRLLETHYLEAIRLTRPASIAARITSKPVVCGRHTLPPNTLVSLVTDSLLVDPKHWGNNATEFDPSRFHKFPHITGNNAKQYPNAAHGLGPRSCPGDLIAYNMGLAFFVAFFNGRYKFILDPTNPPLKEFKTDGSVCRLSEQFRAKVILA